MAASGVKIDGVLELIVPEGSSTVAVAQQRWWVMR